MWLPLAFLSAFLLGFYDISKKSSLKDNPVIPVLFLNTLFCTVIFSPVIFGFAGVEPVKSGVSGISMLQTHLMIILKSFIVLTSWIFGYIGIKHLPLTITAPIHATRPVLVLVGAMLVFGERLNAMQWTGVLLSFFSIFLLAGTSRREQIDFKHNRWIYCVAAAALIGAASGLYDKYLMRYLNPLFVQGWYNFYQMLMMGTVLVAAWLPKKHEPGNGFRWTWAILLISIFISGADYAYFSALGKAGSMVSIVSLIRRSSVLVSFVWGALILKEKNMKAKAADLAFILIGMIFIYLGSR